MIVRSASAPLAVVPARGGSKGVPRKNLQPVAGRPLLAWTLEAVAQAQTAFRLVVSTDDDDIASVARGLGSEVVQRPAELATDVAPTEPALLHVLDELDGAGDADHILLLQATSPIRRPGTLDRAWEAYRAGDADSLVGVVPVAPFLWRGPLSAATPLYDPLRRPRRQDLTDRDLLFRETGSLYITRTDALRETGCRVSGAVLAFALHQDEGLDVDDLDDLAAARRLLGEVHGDR